MVDAADGARSERGTQHRRDTLLSAFALALAGRSQFRLAFQPRIDLASGACVGAETLLRWCHPSLGDISPGEFMPLVEQTSMARDATTWVLDAALRQLAAWRDLGIDLVLSVNVTAGNLEEPDFVQRVGDGLVRHGLSPKRLELEVTQIGLMDDSARALEVLERLAAQGVTLSMDDFGTGTSSVAQLRKLPVQVVKIDRSFMGELAYDPHKQALVTTMISLCHDFGFRVVGEGVETDHVMELLEAADCDEIQGYLVARPMSPETFATWRAAWSGLPQKAAAF